MLSLLIRIKYFTQLNYIVLSDVIGSTMFFLGLLCLLFGVGAQQTLFEELRSSFEFSDFGTNVDEPAYRLRDSVYPTNMTVNLDVFLAESRFNGIVALDVEVTSYIFHLD